VTFYNFPFDRQILFQEAGTANMAFLVESHNVIMFYLIVIIVIIICVIMHVCRYSTIERIVISHYLSNRLQRWSHDDLLESIWTNYPTFIVLLIVTPILIYLFAFEDTKQPIWDIVVKVIGNQWYWTYEAVRFVNDNNLLESQNRVESFVIEARMIEENELLPGQLRLLETDQTLFIPVKQSLHFLVTSTDVIHSWSIPSLGIKIDAVPGRINHTSFILEKPGIYYGQCSELCGTNHAFMPIKIEGFEYRETFNDAAQQTVTDSDEQRSAPATGAAGMTDTAVHQLMIAMISDR
jgi:cytochrome c oxidase subunit 2